MCIALGNKQWQVDQGWKRPYTGFLFTQLEGYCDITLEKWI